MRYISGSNKALVGLRGLDILVCDIEARTVERCNQLELWFLGLDAGQRGIELDEDSCKRY